MENEDESAVGPSQLAVRVAAAKRPFVQRYKINIDVGPLDGVLCGQKIKKFDCCSSIARFSAVFVVLSLLDASHTLQQS